MEKKPDFKRILVTKGDTGFAPAAEPLYSIRVNGRKTRRLYNPNIAIGMPVLWKATTAVGAIPQTVDPTTITAADLPYLRLGVGHSAAKNGIVDSIRAVSIADMGACKIRNIDAYGPACGLSQIEALYPKCLSCDNVSVAINIEDLETQAFHGKRGFETIYAHYTPNCKDCESCDREVTCDEFTCGLVDSINGNLENALVDGLPYPGMQGRDISRKVRAVKLHDPANNGRFLSFCFSPEGTACEGCDRIDALTTFIVNGTTYTFQGVTAPGDNTKTLVKQLKEVELQIEEAFIEEYGQGQHAGFAVLTKSLGDCCGIQLFVSTCDPTFAVTGLTPCPDAIVPFPTFTGQTVCKDCSSGAPNTFTPTCGIAIIAEGYELECGCYPLIDFPSTPLRSIFVDIIDHDLEINPNYHTATLQKPTVPFNYGAQVQAREYHQMTRGEGFEFSQGNNYTGRLGLPDNDSQLENMVTADCRTSYCTYYLETTIVQEEYHVGNSVVQRNIYGELNVPQGDDVTKTAVEGLFARLVQIDPTVCKDLQAATC